MGVELAVVIAELRRELSAAMQAGEGAELRFELGPVELELEVMVGADAGAAGKLKFWVVEAGAEAKGSTQATQRVKLVLDPRRAGAPPLISGDRVPGER